ncbi:MAG: hybrid sensor histidine kinase/response regulator [Chlorobiaceae bacterium]|nr:hybrid sensor histidine kinase/response regulator [Chlorobiaceae bacterium]MBA4309380.1 hybrid sensor histidine kinase/response regulator [Chlorobiaceae bacterium]
MTNGKTKILIVEDEKGLREGIKRLLELEGFQIELAERGTEGIQLGTTNEYDICILDLRLPDYDGIEVLRQIKLIFPNTVCIMATAFASYDTAIEATRLGAFSYIPKPFTPEELLYQIDKACQQRRLILESEKLKKEREERLLELAYEKGRLNTIIKSIADGLLVVNSKGEIVYFNNSCLKNLNINSLKIGEYILHKIPNQIVGMINQLEKDNDPNQSLINQIEIINNNGLYVEAACSPIPFQDGKYSGVVIVIRDITQYKKIEIIKSQFISMVAHELKTPIAAVIGYLKIILDENVNIPAEKEAEYLERSAIRLSGLVELVNDLLDLSRLEVKEKKREFKEIELVKLIKTTIEFLDLEIKKKNIQVEFSSEISEIKLNADSSEMNRVFTNILSNAIKYNREKGKIGINISIDENYFVVKVSDTGIGLKEEDKERLFQEFFRAKNEKTRGIQGTGLGLSIVKRIVESYAGKIEVESEFGKGSVFIIRLPVVN